MPWNLNITQVGLNSKPEAWWNCWTFNLTSLHEEWIFGKSFAQRFCVVSVCIFKCHPAKIYFLAAAVFSGGDFTPALKAGFRAVTHCFRFWGCWVFHCIKVNKTSSIFWSNFTELMLLSDTGSDQLLGSEKKAVPKTSHLLCVLSGCSGQKHYVEKSAVKGGTGRPHLKCTNVRFFLQSDANPCGLEHLVHKGVMPVPTVTPPSCHPWTANS